MTGGGGAGAEGRNLTGGGAGGVADPGARDDWAGDDRAGDDGLRGPRPVPRGWAAIAEEGRRRILAGEWRPGEMIPKEAELAEEWGTTRSTVNRALRRLAEEGLLHRRRKAGTQVAVSPKRPAQFELPLIREEVERTGQRYAYELVDAGEHSPPELARARLGITGRPRVLRVLARHLADGVPLAWEERWINGGTVPEALKVDWRLQSPNEWLKLHVPYTRVDMAMCASEAGPLSARALGCEVGDALLTLERTTWWAQWSVTFVALAYRPGHRLWTVF